MTSVEVRDLGKPEAVVSDPLRISSQVRLAQTVITRHVLQLPARPIGSPSRTFFGSSVGNG